MKLVDTDETIVIITGSTDAAEARDRPLAVWLRQEIDRRGEGHAYRRAVIVGDSSYLGNETLQQNPTIAIGGPGVNAVTHEFVGGLPTVFTEQERIYVQADLESDVKRAALWGSDAAATAAAVDAFVVHGYLDDLLRRIWRFRMELLA